MKKEGIRYGGSEGWTDAFVGLGSNLNAPEKRIREAVRRMAELPEVKVVHLSSLYRTEPVGLSEQPWFINAVAWLSTRQDARGLLKGLLNIEREMGRVRVVPNGPRVIDLDLLLFGESVIQEEGLIIPHPRMHCRRFVLEPLHEIAPRVRHPLLGLSVERLLEDLEDRSIVECMVGSV